MDGMANRALAAVRTGEMAILPARFEKTWNNWLENIRLGLGQGVWVYDILWCSICLCMCVFVCACVCMCEVGIFLSIYC